MQTPKVTRRDGSTSSQSYEHWTPGYLGYKTRTWAPSVNVPYGVSELGAPDGYTAGLAA